MKKSFFNVLVPLKDSEHILHNTVTQRSILLNDHESSQYLSEDLNDLFLSLRLRDIGALVPEKIDEVEQLKDEDISAKKTSEKSLHLTLMMTEACNFGCNYCNQGHDKASNFIGDDVFRSVRNYVLAMPKLESLNVTWYGGEPLIRKKDIIRYSSLIKELGDKKGFKYNSDIITNGYLLDEDTAQSLCKSGIDCAQITIDGCKEDHNNSRYIKEGMDTYQKIVSNIKGAIMSSKLNIVIRVNVSSLNESRLTTLVDDLVNQGVLPNPQVGIYFANIYSPAKNGLEMTAEERSDSSAVISPEKFASIQFHLNKYCWEKGIKVALDMPAFQGACIATKRSSYAISPNGDLHKCYIVMANDEERVGKIKESGAELISNKFNHWDLWSAFEQDECSGCKLLGSCRGGCPLDYIKEGENKGEKTFKCPPAKLYINEYIFQHAVESGIVEPEKWDTELSKTSQDSLRFTK